MDLSREALYQLFLEDLEALRAFEAERTARGLMRTPTDDPDVERLVESIAFFSARTRAAAASATYAAVARMAAGTLDYLLDPMPAAALVRAQGDRASDALEVRRGSLFRLQYPLPGASQAALVAMEGPRMQVGFLSALAPATILPIQIERAGLKQVRRTMAIELELSATAPQRVSRELVFNVRRLGDYRSSLALQVALEQHVRRVTAGPRADAQEVVCQISFGAAPPSAPKDDGDARSPFTRIRSFFHFPEQDLFVRVLVPALARPWTRLTIQLEVDDTWPEEQILGADSFQLFVVPAVNLWSDLAAPLVYDGTKDLNSVRGRTAVDALEAVTVRGVYRADAGMSPLLPFSLGSRDQGWEIVRPFDAGPPMLRVRLPGALTQPAKLSVDAVWSQPGLWGQVSGQPAISLQTQRLQGVTYGLLGSVRRPRPSPLSADGSRGLDLLALRAQKFLSRDAIVGMLELLGADGDSAYRGCPALIETVSTREISSPGRGDLVRVYDVALCQPSVDHLPLLTRFGERVRDVIEAWSEGLVEVNIRSHPSAQRRVTVGR